MTDNTKRAAFDAARTALTSALANFITATGPGSVTDLVTTAKAAATAADVHIVGGATMADAALYNAVVRYVNMRIADGSYNGSPFPAF